MKHPFEALEIKQNEYSGCSYVTFENLKYKYMKNLKFNTSIFILLAILLSTVGCIKQTFDDVAVKHYSVDFEANKFIGDLKAEYTGEDLDLIEEDIIIKGTVIANDESGNFYKTLIIQDSLADGTQGGIEIQLDKTGLYTEFPVGQLVFVKCKGLYLGNYEGVTKLGVDFEGAVGRIGEASINQYLFKSDGGIPIKPRTVSLSILDVDISTDIDHVPNITTVSRSEYVNTLIRIVNSEFNEEELNKTYADAVNKITSEVGFKNVEGDVAMVRTSGYANFAANQIAQGSGDIVGVYNPYRTDKQIYIRDLNDIDLKLARLNARVTMYSFATSISTFKSYSVTGSQVWTYDATYKCALMSGYSSGNKDNEDWLISPAQDLSNATKATLFFSHACKLYTGGSWDMLTIQVSSDYDGVSNPSTQGTWVEYKDYIQNETWTFKSSGPLDLNQFAGQQNVYFAFKYVSTLTGAPKWEIASCAILPE